ncbi:MAG: scaffold protein [Microviridae sp. ctjWc39]|nr:MAG: scaffold protein [Microviridae sp. ctjWc39]QGH72363.1 MAG: scaffold protein [Microviridae sp. ctGWf34]
MRDSSGNYVRVRKEFSKPSMTKQSFREECDINLIMKKFKKVMGADFLSRYSGYAGGQFGDFSQVGDYRSAIDQVNEARASFEALPSIVRKRFGNDPALFLDFCLDPKNLDELVSMGLATKSAPVQDAPSQPPLSTGNSQ